MQTPSLGRVAALLVLLFSIGTQPATGILEEIATGLEIVIHTVESIQQTWEIVEATDVLKHKNQVANPNIKDLVSKKHHELMDRLVEIYRSIESIEHDVSGLMIAAQWIFTMLAEFNRFKGLHYSLNRNLHSPKDHCD